MMIEFCLPVKNEEKILEHNVQLLEKFLQAQKIPADWRIVLIVNGSTDWSCCIAAGLEQDDPKTFKYCFIEQEGKGLALKRYFQESLADVLVFMDTDLATSLDNIPSLIAPILEGSADLVMGSRLLPDSKVDRSPVRRFITRSYNHLSRLILSHSFSDLQCGFKGFKTEVFKRVQPFLVDDIWFFDTELVVLSKIAGFKIKEIPVEWQENRFITRKSKIKIVSDSWSFFRNLLRFKARLFKIKKYFRNA